MIKLKDGFPLVGQHTLDYGNDPYVALANIGLIKETEKP